MSGVILSLEDDDAAFLLLEIAFRELYPDIRLFRAADGAQGLAFLRKIRPHEDAPRPDLLLLDLNMPKVSGFQVLEELRRDQWLRDIPVVVFTSSTMDTDRARCLALGAKQFVSKPHSYEDLLAAIRTACAHAGFAAT